MPIKDPIKRKEYQRELMRKRRLTKNNSVSPVSPNKYYQANSIKVLISLPEYLKLSKDKQKLWSNFNALGIVVGYLVPYLYQLNLNQKETN